MSISIGANKQVKIGETTFSFGEFIQNPENYLGMIQPLFRASSFQAKDGETQTLRYTRLFYLLYYKKGYAADRNNTQTTRSSARTTRTPRQTRTVNTTNEFAILDKLGINMIKHCAKTSRIMFKGTGNAYKMKNEDLDKVLASVKKGCYFDKDNTEIKFGVEFEFVAEHDTEALFNFSKEMRHLVGSTRYVYEGRYHHNDGHLWELGTDCSVRGRGKKGFELTSPIFTVGNKDDWKEIENVINLVKTILGGTTNKTCGTHVHMSFACGQTSEALNKHFAKCYKVNESSLFDRLVPESRRENNNQYCRSVNPDSLTSRYHKLNFTLVGNKCPNMHIEFRQLAGTLDLDVLAAWIKLQKNFVEIALHNATSNKVDQFELEDVLANEDFDSKDVEALMKISKLAA